MFKSKKENPSLSVSNTYNLSKIFKNKNWTTEKPFGTNEFDKFCNLFATLTDEELELMFNLTEDFLWIQANDYIKYFAKAFDSFISKFNFRDIKTIIITPLLTEKDFSKPKSSVMLYYLIAASKNEIQQKYNTFNISFIDTPNKIFDIMKNGNFIVCLIDDFIGTGETAFSATQFFMDKNILNNNIAIVSLVAMKVGYNYLKTEGLEVFYSILKEKGISDSYRNVEKETLIMQEIEQKIGVKPSFKFGYG